MTAICSAKRLIMPVNVGISLLMLVLTQNLSGQVVQTMGTGSSSKKYKQSAIAKIPFNELTPAMARQVADVVQHTSIYRQLPITSVESDPDLYLYLVRYPEVVISIWRLMGVSQMKADRVGNFQLRADDGAGTNTDVQLIYGKPKLNIYYAEGEYDGPMLFRRVTGKCVLVLESDYRRNSAGKVIVTSRLNVFLKIDNLAASIIARTVHPFVGTTADHNFVESLRFIEKLSSTTQENGPGVQQMTHRLTGLTPDVRGRFVDIAGIAYERELHKSANQSKYYQQAQSGTISRNYRPTNRSPVNRSSYRGR